MKDTNIFQTLAKHLQSIGMGYPPSEHLEQILKDNFSQIEAEVTLALPAKIIPLQPVSVSEIAKSISIPREELANILEGLAQKGLIFSGKTEDGTMGYALQQRGFGFPQTFFWKGEDTSHSRNMADLVGKCFDTENTRKTYGGTPTKPYRFIPVNTAIDFELQSVYPYHLMENVINNAQVIAVAHCACRVRKNLLGQGCNHRTENCMKFDEMAEYIIERKLAREISKEEARAIIKQVEEDNLIHFVDNAAKGVKHNCNCCGCACWSAARIKTRAIPRDVIMATYFIRETDVDDCTGCGACVDVCPVECLALEDDIARVEEEWCVGCGVCIDKCPTGAATLRIRPDKLHEPIATDFRKLHEQIIEERGVK